MRKKKNFVSISFLRLSQVCYECFHLVLLFDRIIFSFALKYRIVTPTCKMEFCESEYSFYLEHRA